MARALRPEPRVFVVELEDSLLPFQSIAGRRSGRLTTTSVLILSVILPVSACDSSAPVEVDETPQEGVTRSMGVGINIGFYNPSAGLDVFAADYNTASWSPGDQPFNDDFLLEMAPFETIRFHQFHRVSFSDDEQWSDRPSPTTQIHLSGGGDIALAYEWEIRLSNALGTHYWLNTPAKADSMYLAALAALVHDQLDSNLNVYLEYSNEVWNPAYAEEALWDDNPGMNGQFTVATDRGIELGLAGAGESDLARARHYVYASVRLWQAFLDEFGDDSRLINVLGSVNDEDVFWDGAMQMAALDNPAINPRGLRPDRFSIATYVGTAHDGASSTLFDSELPADLAVLLQGYRVARSGLDAAGYSDVAINSYEGGTHILRNADVGNRNPGIYDFYREMLDALEAEGFASFQHYVATSEHYEGQGFGFNEYTGQPEETAPKWRALRDWIEGR